MIPQIAIIRLHQWYKSLICLLPMVLMDIPFSWPLIGALVLGFSLASSAVYVFNDLCDLEADKISSDRRDRPLANGSVRPSHAYVLIPCLMAASLWIWPAELSSRWLVIYWMLNFAYNVTIKPYHGYGFSTAIVVEACYLIRLMPLICLDGHITQNEWMLLCSLAMTVWPLIAWKQRSYLMVWHENLGICKFMGQIGIALATLVLFQIIGYWSLILWTFGLAGFLRVLAARDTREPYRALLRI